MTDLWVARDADGTLTVFDERPTYKLGVWCTSSMYPFDFTEMNHELFPDLLPGECRRLVLAEEKSE